ncbi:hypothetical protein L6452_16534 [Arctium lappa]|uniref:Uncharacterized protein n=1 Tax=Arctium lappa TaxID=4217 RepID=A0ACB9C0X6_ARCLA|nr:hypothetical protein L6452_16534 [Arctium lappa]
MNLICLGCQTIPRTTSSNDIREGYEGELDQSPPTLLLLGQRSSPSKLVRGQSTSNKLKDDQSMIIGLPAKPVLHNDKSIKRKEINNDACKPRLTRSSGMRRDWSLEDLRQLMNTR